MAINIAPPYLDSVPIARGIVDAARATGKPIVTSFLPEAVTADAIAYLQENGILNFPTPNVRSSALANLARYARARRPTRTRMTPMRRSPMPEPPRAAARARSSNPTR